MIRGLLNRTREISIGEKGLNRVISVDTEGGEVRVRDLLQKAGTRASRRAKAKPVSTLNESEKERVVKAYLNSIPQGRAIALSGHGSFTADSLKNELRKHTAVAEEITDVVLRHSRFIEKAIKEGRVRLLSNSANQNKTLEKHTKVLKAKVEG